MLVDSVVVWLYMCVFVCLCVCVFILICFVFFGVCSLLVIDISAF